MKPHIFIDSVYFYILIWKNMQHTKWTWWNEVSYPMTQDVIDSLKPCKLVNPYSLDDPRVSPYVSKERVEKMKWPQLWSEEFEQEIMNVVKGVKLSKEKTYFNSDDSHDFSAFQYDWIEWNDILSDVFKEKFNVNQFHEAGEAVHTDWPTEIIDATFKRLLERWVPFREELFKRRTTANFTETVVFAHKLFADLVLWTSYPAFAVKYHLWFPRPEEVIHARAKGEFKVSSLLNDFLEHNVDKEEVLKNPASFTIYPEWCPNHPSRPAMHSAVASVLIAMQIIFDFSNHAYEENEVRKVESWTSFFRTVAGVHRIWDNIMWINLWRLCAKKTIEESFESSKITYDPEVLAKLIEEKVQMVSYSYS